jgi:hypothetical protein
VNLLRQLQTQPLFPTLQLAAIEVHRNLENLKQRCIRRVEVHPNLDRRKMRTFFMVSMWQTVSMFEKFLTLRRRHRATLEGAIAVVFRRRC